MDVKWTLACDPQSDGSIGNLNAVSIDDGFNTKQSFSNAVGMISKWMDQKRIDFILEKELVYSLINIARIANLCCPVSQLIVR